MRVSFFQLAVFFAISSVYIVHCSCSQAEEIVDPLKDFVSGAHYPIGYFPTEKDQLETIKLPLAGQQTKEAILLTFRSFTDGKYGRIWTVYLPGKAGYTRVEKSTAGAQIEFRPDAYYYGPVDIGPVRGKGLLTMVRSRQELELSFYEFLEDSVVEHKLPDFSLNNKTDKTLYALYFDLPESLNGTPQIEVTSLEQINKIGYKVAVEKPFSNDPLTDEQQKAKLAAENYLLAREVNKEVAKLAAAYGKQNNYRTTIIPNLQWLSSVSTASPEQAAKLLVEDSAIVLQGTAREMKVNIPPSPILPKDSSSTMLIEVTCSQNYKIIAAIGEKTGSVAGRHTFESVASSSGARINESLKKSDSILKEINDKQSSSMRDTDKVPRR